MTGRQPLRLLQGYGVEIEFMIVDEETLDVKPLCDEVLRVEGGGYDVDVERGPIAWSNELALHVVELKTNGPAPSLAGRAAAFANDVARVEEILAPFGARLLPTAMHPWMNPARETTLWPHANSPVYQTFDRIFDCRGHGWSNLQSTHLNLPFGDDVEFGRLHAAIRLLLPIIPALAASSPFVEGKATGLMDSRLEVYRFNSRRIPSVTGAVVPERVFTRADYEREILERIYADMAPLDPEGVLRYEFANARGAIARFDRDAIEIRVVDSQECPLADLAIAAAEVEVVRLLLEERTCSGAVQRDFEERSLAAHFIATVYDGEEAVIDDAGYLSALGLTGRSEATAGEIWRHLLEDSDILTDSGSEFAGPLEVLLTEGPLARRILRATDRHPDREILRAVYGELADCLRENRLFRRGP
jgi:gamma-glutamyl:cysteine ligase YbdK (ATP-grasp superfamily)